MPPEKITPDTKIHHQMAMLLKQPAPIKSKLLVQ
jgi:hypothetical protein